MFEGSLSGLSRAVTRSESRGLVVAVEGGLLPSGLGGVTACRSSTCAPLCSFGGVDEQPAISPTAAITVIHRFIFSLLVSSSPCQLVIRSEFYAVIGW